MPAYDYQCQDCQAFFEVRATFKEKAAGLQPACPKCQSQAVRQVITAGLVIHTSDGSTLSLSGCGPDAKPGCCG